jgi:hypothetical protein
MGGTLKGRRRNVKKVIELLEEALKKAKFAQYYSPTPRMLDTTINLIQETIALLKALPRWETPEQWEKRNGRKYQNKGPVWFRHTCKNYRGEQEFIAWFLKEYKDARDDYDFHLPDYKQIVVATEAGPPPKDWKPEEEKDHVVK